MSRHTEEGSSSVMRAQPMASAGRDRPGPDRSERFSKSRAVALGVTASAFFAVTFVVNRRIADARGHWAWTASLRYLLTAPLLVTLLAARRRLPALAAAWRAAPAAWVAWGTVGFTVFYAAISLAGALAPAWVVAGSWSVTVVAGVLLAPILYDDHRRAIPRRALLAGAVVVAGVLLVQARQASATDPRTAAAGLALVLVAAFAYPLGNRKMMLALERSRAPDVDPFVRVAAMTAGSLPAWLVVSAYGLARAGWPPAAQVAQAGVVGVSSGIVATALFFAATDRVRQDPLALAAVEATQAAEVPFALVLEVLLLGAPWPDPVGWAGLGLIVAGILWCARATAA
jgi:drug/metabolite transporter (DMT)-like permease